MPLSNSNVVDTTGSMSTYSASILGLVPAATPTDIFEISGSATKTVRITRIRFTATKTASATIDLVLARRSTANTAGTSTTPTVVSADSLDAAGTAVVKAYTANPTVGTLVGNMRADKMFVSAPGAGISEIREYLFGVEGAKTVVLRGTTESVCINLNAVTMTGGSIDTWVVWTEE